MTRMNTDKVKDIFVVLCKLRPIRVNLTPLK